MNLTTTLTAASMGRSLETLARVLDTDADGLVARMVADGIEAALADDDVRAAHEALLRLDARRGRKDDRPDAEAVGRPGLCVHAEAEHSRTDGERILGSAPVGPERDTRSPAPNSVQPRQVADSESSRVDQPNSVRGGVTSSKEGGDAAGVAASEAAPSSGPRAAQLSPVQRSEIGAAVRAKRHARGLSQADAGAEIGCSGVTLGYVEAAMAKASVAIVAKCEAWALASHPCDAQPHARTRKMPRQGNGAAVPDAKTATPEEARRHAASAVRARRLAHGLTIQGAAGGVGIDELALLAIEEARPVSDADLRRAVAWAQAE